MFQKNQGLVEALAEEGDVAIYITRQTRDLEEGQADELMSFHSQGGRVYDAVGKTVFSKALPDLHL